MVNIKFGTDGWRAIIAQEYTNDNVARVTKATADWLNQQFKKSKVVIGHDCRFGGKMFSEVVARVFCGQGIEVIMADKFATTPMVSYATKVLGAQQGIVITASHNPPDYNGFKLKADFGGPSTPEMINQVESLIPENAYIPNKSVKEYEEEGLLTYVDLESLYLKAVEESFDLEAIRKSGINIAYDAMYGAGQSIVQKIFPDAACLHCDINPSFRGQAPEPLAKNLTELSQLIKDRPDIHAGLANDGDADRIGMFDGDGNFVDSHHIILLLVHYLHKYKGMTGKVVNAFSVTARVRKMCELYGLEYEVTKIGFKHICLIMIKEDVLLGGEESGGIAVKGFIPERDGVWMALLLFEFMAKTGKSLKELIQEVYDVVGSFYYERNDLHITDKLKQQIMAKCEAGEYKSFGDYEVKKIETVDGFKFFLSETNWLMIRPSGTEPVLRVYAEGKDEAEAKDILSQARATLLN